MWLDIRSIAAECDGLDQVAMEHGPVDWRLNLIGIAAEFGEFLQEIPYRHWRISDVQAYHARQELTEKAYDEFADLLVTVIRVGQQAGVQMDILSVAIERHIAKKWQRLGSGIDR